MRRSEPSELFSVPTAFTVPLGMAVPLPDFVVRSEDVGQPIQFRVLHQGCGERDALKLNSYFEWSPHRTRQ